MTKVAVEEVKKRDMKTGNDNNTDEGNEKIRMGKGRK